MSNITHTITVDGVEYGTVEVIPMDEGDLCLSVRRPGVHPDDEAAVITISAYDGIFAINVQDESGNLALISLHPDGAVVTKS